MLKRSMHSSNHVDFVVSSLVASRDTNWFPTTEKMCCSLVIFLFQVPYEFIFISIFIFMFVFKFICTFKNCHNLQRFFLKIIRSCLEVSIGVDPTGAISCYLGSWGCVFWVGRFLGGGFNYFWFSSRTLGKWSRLTSIFFKWVETTN